MGSNSQLEQAIDKILLKTTDRILSGLDDSCSEAIHTIDDSLSILEQEYDKLITDGKKEADKIKKQIIGSSDLGARNEQLISLEQAVDDVFEKALEKITNTARSGNYENLIKTMIEESTNILGTTEVILSTNSKDRGAVQLQLAQFSGAILSDDVIDCIGGVVAMSKDGTMKFDNTIDARIERLKPLIRKEIASMFGVGN